MSAERLVGSLSSLRLSEASGSDAKARRKAKTRLLIERFVSENLSLGVAIVKALKLLLKLVRNVITNPHEPKYRRVSATNRRFQAVMGGMVGAQDVLQGIGFQLVHADKPYWVLMDKRGDRVSLTDAYSMLEGALKGIQELYGGLQAVAGPPDATTSIATKTSNDGSLNRQNQIEKPRPPPKRDQKALVKAREYQCAFGVKKTAKRRGTGADQTAMTIRSDQLPSRRQMAKLVEARLAGKKGRGKSKSGAPQLDIRGGKGGGAPRRGRIGNFNKNSAHNDSASVSGLVDAKSGKKHYTASELEALAKTRYEDPKNYGNVADMDHIGRQALRHTNAFRAKNGLPRLYWSPVIADVSRVHSKGMGDARVPFGHAGFKQRVAQLRPRGLHHRSAAENVAMNGARSYTETARMAVEGWIKSPGHRKNLLSKSNYCGIGVYRNFYGQYYLTQIFADVDETQLQAEARARAEGRK